MNNTDILQQIKAFQDALQTMAKLAARLTDPWFIRNGLVDENGATLVTQEDMDTDFKSYYHDLGLLNAAAIALPESAQKLITSFQDIEIQAKNLIAQEASPDTVTMDTEGD